MNLTPRTQIPQFLHQIIRTVQTFPQGTTTEKSGQTGPSWNGQPARIIIFYVTKFSEQPVTNLKAVISPKGLKVDHYQAVGRNTVIMVAGMLQILGHTMAAMQLGRIQVITIPTL